MSSEALLSNIVRAKKVTIHRCSCDDWDDLFRCGLYNLSLRGGKDRA
jgi:hypothetical protein